MSIKNLYVFGDSFIHEHKLDENEYAWPEIWFQGSDYEFIFKHSKPGTSNNAIFSEIQPILDRLTPDDGVIIAWSSRYRHTILSSIMNNNQDFTLNSGDQNPINKDFVSTYFSDYYSLETETQNLIAYVTAVHEQIKSTGAKLVQFLGHDDFSDTKMNDDLTMHLHYRMLDKITQKRLEKYITKMPYTGCLLHEWMFLQYEKMGITNTGVNWTPSKHFRRNYNHFSESMFIDFEQSGENMFVDVWHLNSYGNNEFAKHIQPILDENL